MGFHGEIFGVYLQYKVETETASTSLIVGKIAEPTLKSNLIEVALAKEP